MTIFVVYEAGGYEWAGAPFYFADTKDDALKIKEIIGMEYDLKAIDRYENLDEEYDKIFEKRERERIKRNEKVEEEKRKKKAKRYEKFLKLKEEFDD